MKPISVRYKPGFSVIMFVAGTFMLGVGLLIGEPLQLLLGTMNIALGFGFATQPIWVLTESQIQMRNLLGMTLKRHDYGSLAELEIRGSAVHRREDGKKLTSKSFVGRNDDWAAVVEAIEATQ